MIEIGYGKTVVKMGMTSGVYFLKSRGEIIYIGKLDNVFQRVFCVSHMVKKFDEAEIHWIPKAEMQAYEATQIKIHQPPLNIEGVKARARPSWIALAEKGRR